MTFFEDYKKGIINSINSLKISGKDAGLLTVCAVLIGMCMVITMWLWG